MSRLAPRSIAPSLFCGDLNASTSPPSSFLFFPHPSICSTALRLAPSCVTATGSAVSCFFFPSKTRWSHQRCPKVFVWVHASQHRSRLCWGACRHFSNTTAMFHVLVQTQPVCFTGLMVGTYSQLKPFVYQPCKPFSSCWVIPALFLVGEH